MDEARDDGEGEAPGDVVVVGVEQPIASPAATSENEHGEEEKQCCKNEKKLWNDSFSSRSGSIPVTALQRNARPQKWYSNLRMTSRGNLRRRATKISWPTKEKMKPRVTKSWTTINQPRKKGHALVLASCDL